MKVEAGFINDEGERVIETMSDVKWDMLCLTDRLFHPEKYAACENIERSIRKITERIKRACASRVNRAEVTLFIEECRKLQPEEKEEAEKSILRQIADTY